MQIAIYIAAVLGWVGMYLMLPREQWRLGKVGALVAGAALIGLFVAAATQVGEGVDGPGFYFYVFSILAIACAVRVITHPRPVYSALYFVMVVLASSGLFLLLQAEFMAFAMIIIYAGAILVTYLFVIMLATQPQAEGEEGPFYDRVAREPFAGSLVGFALVAVLTSVFFGGIKDLDRPFPESLASKDAAATTLLVEMPGKAEQALTSYLKTTAAGERKIEKAHAVKINAADVAEIDAADATKILYDVVDGKNMLIVRRTITEAERDLLAGELTNIDEVGLNLFQSHTLGIELAAIILLLSMVGAVVIANKRVDSDVDDVDATGPDRLTKVETTHEPAPTDDRSMGISSGAASEST